MTAAIMPLVEKTQRQDDEKLTEFKQATAKIMKEWLALSRQLTKTVDEYYRESVERETAFMQALTQKIRVAAQKTAQPALADLRPIDAHEEKFFQQNSLMQAKVIAEYDEKIRAVDLKLSAAAADKDNHIAAERAAYQEYGRGNKARIAKLKNAYTDNLQHHERTQEKRYRAAVQKNEKERKYRIKSL